jgi:hypothetical protein
MQQSAAAATVDDDEETDPRYKDTDQFTRIMAKHRQRPQPYQVDVSGITHKHTGGDVGNPSFVQRLQEQAIHQPAASSSAAPMARKEKSRSPPPESHHEPKGKRGRPPSRQPSRQPASSSGMDLEGQAKRQHSTTRSQKSEDLPSKKRDTRKNAIPIALSKPKSLAIDSVSSQSQPTPKRTQPQHAKPIPKSEPAPKAEAKAEPVPKAEAKAKPVPKAEARTNKTRNPDLAGPESAKRRRKHGVQRYESIHISDWLEKPLGDLWAQYDIWGGDRRVDLRKEYTRRYKKIEDRKNAVIELIKPLMMKQGFILG